MLSLKGTQGQPTFVPATPHKKRLTRPLLARRSKSQGNLPNLTIDTDVWQAHDDHIYAPDAPQSSAHSETTGSPSPPPSAALSTMELDGAAPFYGKIAAWQRDIAMPLGDAANIDVTAITTDNSGARLTTNAQGTKLLMMADASSMHSISGIKDLMLFGLTRHATRLSYNSQKQKLVRCRMDGKKVAVRSGTYAFVIDQDGDVLLSLTASPNEGAPAGAHLNLAAGLPVLFAGELTLADGAIVSYTPMSGTYRTPVIAGLVARNHPLLQAAALHAPSSWLAEPTDDILIKP